MLTVIIKRIHEPTVVQFTLEQMIKLLAPINGAELLVEDSWAEGLSRVRTPYVCLVEDDCTLSAAYMMSNFGLMRKNDDEITGGGNRKVAMLASCLGIKTFAERVYSYRVEKGPWRNGGSALVKNYEVRPNVEKHHTEPYEVQIGFVPGAIIRMGALGKDTDKLPWDSKNLIELSEIISFHFWDTNRRVKVNPNTTYVSTEEYLEETPVFRVHVPETVANIFAREAL